MNDRARAIAILKQAREMLFDRLTDRIVESRDEILEDAQGFSYLGEIETIYEQLGARLVHVNQLLANLPAADEAPPPAAPGEAPVHPVEVHLASCTNEPLLEGSAVVTRSYVGIVGPALPAPSAELTTETARSFTFQPFAAQIHAGDLASAGRSLADLFGLSEARGIECTRVFAEHMRTEPGFLLKAVQLRNELQSGGWNGAVTLLWECFGLGGLESLGVLQTLRSRFDLGD